MSWLSSFVDNNKKWIGKVAPVLPAVVKGDFDPMLQAAAAAAGAGGAGGMGAGASDLFAKLPASVRALLANAPGALGSVAGKAGDFLGGNSGLNALSIAQLANAAALGQKSSNFAEMAGKNVDEFWKQRAPLRVGGIAGMQAPPVADTSGLRQTSARGNPFANRPVAVSPLGTRTLR